MYDDCREARRLLQDFLDGECEPAVQQTITLHLRDCPPCLRRADFERELRVFVAVRCRETAPRDLLDRVVVRLHGV